MRKLLSTWDNIKNTKVCLFTVLSSISWFTPAGSLLSGINEFTFSMYTVTIEAFWTRYVVSNVNVFSLITGVFHFWPILHAIIFLSDCICVICFWAVPKMPDVNLLLPQTRRLSDKAWIVIGTSIRSTYRIKTVSTAVYVTYTPDIFCIFITLSPIFANSTFWVFSLNFCPRSFIFSFSWPRAIIRITRSSWYHCYLFLVLASSSPEEAFILVSVSIWSTNWNIVCVTLELTRTFQAIALFLAHSSIFTWWFITHSYIRFPYI